VVHRLMHQFPEDSPITAKFQEAELDYLLHSAAGSLSIAENYVGLPLDFGAFGAATAYIH
jgi:p-hydroxybenzoate 3-monooxygenase